MKNICLAIMMIFLVAFVSAEFGYNDLDGAILTPSPLDSANVNNSQYLQGYTPVTLYDYYKSLFDNVYCKLTGCTMQGDIDMDSNNILNVGNINASGYISGRKCGVFASLDSATPTTITTAGTYYPIAGNFTNSPMEEFGAATTYTPGIKYTGTKTQYFEIDWCAVGSGDSAGITTHLGIKKNGVLCTGGVMGTFLKFVGEKQALSGTCVIELATNDEIQLVITADGSGDIVTMNQFTTTITEFFD